jgi:8-oxo-dGTP pyrophosphatase MutT (NUDIX family)
MFPGGGREEGEEEAACVAREVLEECGLIVNVDRLLSDVPAQPRDGTYLRWRTYQCTIISGEPKAGGGEGPNAELVATTWLPLHDTTWPDEIASDQFLYPQLLALQASLHPKKVYQSAQGVQPVNAGSATNLLSGL